MCVVFKAKLFCFWLIIGLVFFWGATGMFGETFTVNSLGDSVDVNPGDGVAVDRNGMCTLRAAIMEANALFGPDEIILPKRIINLSIKGYGEDQCRTGDLDITSNLTIRGQGKLISIIDGNQIDRVFHIRGAWHVTLADLTIRNGKGENGKDVTQFHYTEKVAGMGKHGGGILNVNGILLLERVAIVENAAGDGGDGGGLYSRDGDVVIRETSVCRNDAGSGGGVEDSGNGGHGGGIYTLNGTLLVERCLIHENKAGNGGYDSRLGGSGGGVCSIDAKTRILNTTISFNYFGIADTSGLGGGVYQKGGEVELIHCTIYRNNFKTSGTYGYFGGGGGVFGQNVYVKDSVIFGNRVGVLSQGNDFDGVMRSGGYNLLGDPDGCTIEGDTTGNIIGEDPLLKPLANNGGACMTYALFPSSPALDAADPSDTVETDQRGVKRPQDGDGDGSPRSDIGAFELSFPSVRIVAPENGAVVRGDVRFAFEAENYEYVSVSLSYAPFYAELREEPLEFVWHTFWWYPRGPYRVKAAAVDGMGQIAQAETGFYLDNLRMELVVTKGVERSWLIQKEFADLDLTLWMLEIELIDHLEVQRKVGGGAYRTIKTAPLEEYKTGKYRYQDILPRTKSVIMYRVVAYDKDGNELGTSPKRQAV